MILIIKKDLMLFRLNQKITDNVSNEWISWIKEVKSNNINILVIHEIGTGGSIVQIIKLESFTILPLRKSFMR